jgi:hypothetical protein
MGDNFDFKKFLMENRLGAYGKAPLNEEEHDFISDYERGAVNRDLTDYEKSLVGQKPYKMKGDYTPKTAVQTHDTPEKMTPEQKKEQEVAMTDALIDAGVFTRKHKEDFPDTWSGQGGYSEVQKVLMQGAEEGKWDKSGAEDFLRRINRSWD